MLRYSETFLVRYMRRHPDLFPDEVTRAVACPGRKESSGFPSEAAFQAAAVDLMHTPGWHVQESLKGSAGGGTVYTTPGWPDLMMYRWPELVWWAELKQPGRTLLPEQQARHMVMKAAGLHVVVAEDLATLLRAEAEARVRDHVRQPEHPGLAEDRRRDLGPPSTCPRARAWWSEWDVD